MSLVDYHPESGILRLWIYVQPKASRDQIVGEHNEELKIAITAPPVDGQANQHLIKFLAKQCKVAKSAVSVEKGEQGRHKQVVIHQPVVIPEMIATLLAR